MAICWGVLNGRVGVMFVVGVITAVGRIGVTGTGTLRKLPFDGSSATPPTR